MAYITQMSRSALSTLKVLCSNQISISNFPGWEQCGSKLSSKLKIQAGKKDDILEENSSPPDIGCLMP